MKNGSLTLLVTIFDKIHKQYLGTWKFAETREFTMVICLFKVDKRNTKTRCKICSKLRTKTPEWRQWRFSGVFLNSEHISHLALYVVIPDFVNVSTRCVVSESIKRMFPTLLILILKRVCRDFISYKVWCIKVYRFCSVFHIFQNALSRCIMLNPLEDIFHSVHVWYDKTILV